MAEREQELYSALMADVQISGFRKAFSLWGWATLVVGALGMLFLLSNLRRIKIGLAGAIAVILLFFLIELGKTYLQRAKLTTTLSTLTLRKAQLEDERLELSSRLIRAQEEERCRIGRELHDDLNQQVAFLACGLALLSRNSPQSLRQEIRRLLEIAKCLSERVHQLSHELHSSVLDHLGLVAAARALCDEFSIQRRIAIRFVERNVPEELSPETSLCLFRILQESLSNISKHSRATGARVTIAGGSIGVHLETQDNGVGFDSTDRRKRSGLGLLSMAERLRLVGGSLEIDSHPTRGTTVNAWVPATLSDRSQPDTFARRRPPAHAATECDGENDGARTGTLG